MSNNLDNIDLFSNKNDPDYDIDDDDSSTTSTTTNKIDSSSDDDISETNEPNILSDDIIFELESTALELMEDYIEIEILSMSSPHFNEYLIKEVSILLFEQIRHLFVNYSSTGLYDEITEIVKYINNIYFSNLIDVPPRSYDKSIILNSPCIEEITDKLNNIRNIYQPKQKTLEWYEFRHGLFTASSIWKIFNTTQQNNIIYEKCKPFVPITSTTNNNNGINVNSTLHWGIKYEPVSLMIYENKFNTKVEDFGCIRHPNYYFIGASPDGINVDSMNPRFGRMIEIKNIVNRNITLFPKEEYWIQMQIQMETCNLNECDFIETRFKEIKEELFYSNENNYEYKGVILYFIDNNNNYIIDEFSLSPSPLYEYMPLNIIHPLDISEWINNTINKNKSISTLYKTIYWGLDEFSCILVPRNKKWFEKALPLIENTWKIIEKEKIEGYEYRCPKKNKININLESIIREFDFSNNENHTIIVNKLDHE
jgi:hypothetical protein